ncbi:MAG: GTP cyclohydrolase I FolE2 [Verrucomicrobia bacterium]|nr:GTP cyclohydrolase I FolE2 [Verrucomicrobiota bacterium]MCG2681064.1 GTP cyclohydrolase FolE2 [Kiritimatiellia bacterium]MBU4248293.1 GTP cyclohydrolase I FolE2 [Verrucomicrobiota bacterium]MBU4290487.1 GTP cyclohydrolase I FolE2 [Verrucomicrobiota bacterium]MBU4427870.1 GTP cyclohydrolase I FolE2 [Verrucomicrobiota bacterium]
MKDIQNTRDFRQIPIQKAGVKNLQYPIAVLDRENKVQHTVGNVSMYVDLPHHFKGTHMSRFIELLNEHRGKISLRNIGAILKTMVNRFDSTTAHLEIRFPYFMEKSAPVSKARSLMNYQCAFLATYSRKCRPAPLDLIVEVMVPVSTLCPCSKAISDHGAHNQRSWITLQVRSRELVWIEELIEIAEAEASSGLYSLLKREDEKHVTERAYSRPRFAEDVARAVARKLKKDPRITWFQVASENLESIHNHNAYALVTSDSLR